VGNAAPAAGILDSAGDAYRAYDVEPGTLVLVRPDGYIGVITGHSSAGSVDEYLKHVCAGLSPAVAS
jgi:hypothetical protein